MLKILPKTNHQLSICEGNFLRLNSFIIRIQLCLDAKLAEVISYQGEKPIPYFMGVSKTQSKDEKIQQNRFLTEWLESIFCSGICSEIKFNE